MHAGNSGRLPDRNITLIVPFALEAQRYRRAVGRRAHAKTLPIDVVETTPVLRTVAAGA